MTWLEIYNKTCLKLWGNSVVPEGMQNALQGEYGIIANAHHRIQEDFNYWFMEASTTFTMQDGVDTYALPTNFKEVVQQGLRFKDATTGDYYDPVSPMYLGDYTTFKDGDSETDYPTFYEIWGNSLVLKPTPATNGILLYMRYYKYLDRPTAFDGTFDLLTRAGYDAIVSMACAEVCRIQEELQKQQVFEAEVSMEIQNLKLKDDRRRRAEVNQCRYVGF